MTTRQRRANYSSQKYTIKAAKDKMEKENLIIGRNTVKEAIKSGRDMVLSWFKAEATIGR